MTTIKQVLHAARQQFASVSESASLDAQLLLAFALGVDRAYLLAHPEHVLTAAQAQQVAALVQRRATGEPIPYITGVRAFYDRDFEVTPAVLIPRPETELLLERALHFTAQHPGAAVVDVGTGSGALAVTLAALTPTATVCATDISPAALAVARRNAARHQAPVTFYEGDLLQPLIERGLRVDVVMANLPYIASAELPALAVSRHEPHLALDGGADGLDLIRRLLDQLPSVGKPGALVLLEIGADQGPAALALVRAAVEPAALDLVSDYAGLDRIVVFTLGATSSRCFEGR